MGAEAGSSGPEEMEGIAEGGAEVKRVLLQKRPPWAQVKAKGWRTAYILADL